MKKEQNKRPHKKQASASSMRLALENRLLFDGAVVASAAEVADDKNAGQDNRADTNTDNNQDASLDALGDFGQIAAFGFNAQAVDSQPIPPGTTMGAGDAPILWIVDPRSDQSQQLLANQPQNSQVYFIEPNQDGYQQIAQLLPQRGDIQQVHILTADINGNAWLGASQLGINTTVVDQSALMHWGDFLADNTSIVFHGDQPGINPNWLNTVDALTGGEVRWSQEPVDAAAAAQLVFIDTSVTDYQTLLNGTDPDATVILLNPIEDGIQRIAEVVSRYDDIQAIHILSHGEAGQINLGIATLNQSNIQSLYADEFATISQHLSADADILIYGCNFGQDAVAINTIATLTKADVAASTNDTGAAALSADWILENQIGGIESPIAISAAGILNYKHKLDPPLTSLDFSGTVANGDIVFTNAPVAGLLNDSWRYINVGTVNGNVIDALITVTFVNGANTSLNNIDAAGGTNAGLDTYFQPVISGVPSQNGYIQFRMDFVVTGTSNAVQLTNFVATGSDLDGIENTTASEFARWSNVDSFATQTPTDLTQPSTSTASNPAFQNFNSSFNGITLETAALNYSVFYAKPVSSITFQLGVIGSSTGAFNNRQNSISFRAQDIQAYNSPVAVPDSATVNEDSIATILILDNDWGGEQGADGSRVQTPLRNDRVDLDPSTVGVFETTRTIAGQGRFDYNGNGIVTFTPDANFNGNVTPIQYTVNNSQGETSNPANIRVAVSPVNDTPVNTVPRATLTISEDVRRPIIGVQVADPDEGQTGSPASHILSSVQLRVSNGTLRVNTNTGATISGNDTGTLTLSGTQTQINAALTSLSYLSNLNSTIGDSLVMVSTDGLGLTDTDIVNIAIAPVNDTPVNTLPALYTTNEDTAFTLTGLSISDIDSGSGAVTVNLFVNLGEGAFAATSANGVTVALNANGNSITLTGTVANINAYLASANRPSFTPGANLTGDIRLRMTTNDVGNTGIDPGLTGNATSEEDVDTTIIRVTPVNDAPTVIVPARLTTSEDATLTIAGITFGDPDAGNNGIQVTINIPVNSGNLVWTATPFIGVDPASTTTNLILNGSYGLINSAIASGALKFVPTPDFNTGNGAFTLTASINDLSNVGGVSALTASATTLIAVTPVADIVTDTYTGTEDTPIIFNPLTGAVSGATGGGADSFENNNARNTAINGTSISVGGSVAVTGGVLSLGVNNVLTFKPDNNLNGPVPKITYTVTSGGVIETADINITLASVNDAPVAVNDSATTNEDTAVTTANVLLNDSDVDNTLTPASITAFSQGANGSVVNNGDGTFSYTPNANFNGTDSFSYTITDAGGLTSTATVTVTVNPVNDAPVDGNETNTVTEDTSLDILDGATGDLLNNATDVDGGTLRITQFTVNGQTIPVAANTPVFSPAGGSATIVGVGTIDILSNGAYTFTPAPNYTGSIPPITYTVGDGNGGTDTSTLQLTMVAVNDAPVAVNDSATTNEDTAVTTANVLLNDSDVDNALTPASITAFTQGANGSVVNNGDGTFSYTPNPNFNGTDSFSYTITDAGGLTSTATVTVTVNPVNDAPVDGNETNTVTEDTSLDILDGATGDLLNNATDVDGGTLRITQFTVNGQTIPVAANTPVFSPAGGSATIVGVGTIDILSNGAYTFTPAPNYTGSIPLITYTVGDGNGGTDTSTLQLTMVAVNDAPVAVNDSATTNEDTAVTTANVLLNDSDVDNALTPASITAFSQGANGSVVNNGDGTFSYTPNPNFNGTDSFTYTITDAGGLTSTATVTVTVNPVNDAPVATPDSAVTDEDTPVTTANVLLNDSDVDNALTPASITAFTQGANGSVVNNGDGTFSYTPNPNFNGTDSFTYTITDAGGLTSTATVTVTVNPVNDAPVATPDSAVTDEDTPVITANVLLNDSDVDNALTPASITAFTQGANGSVVNNGDGTFSYTPNPNFNGTDSFTYTITDAGGLTSTATVTVTVNPVNDAPVATPDSAVTDEDTPVTTANVLLNDSDVDNALTPASITAFTQGANGSVVNNGDGTFSYTPNPNFNGTDSFSYTITDAGGLTSTATVTVTVNPVNDAPVDGNETNTVTEDTSLDILDGATGDLLNNATDVDGGTLRITQFTVNGQTIPVAANTPVFSPAGGSATIVGVGTIDILSNGAYTFTPASNYTGSIPPITYTVGDGNGGTDTSTLQLTMVAVNDAPVAVNDSATTNEDTAVTTANVLLNDSDVDNALTPASITAFTQGANGSVVNNGDGTFSYTPNPNFNGTDSFTYTITDAGGLTSTATVTVTVNPVNDAPVDGNETNTVTEDTSLDILDGATGDLLNNATDVDGGTLRITQFTVNGQTIPVAANTPVFSPAGGSATIVGVGTIDILSNGAYTFTPAPNYTGSIPLITYTVGDGNGGTDTSTLQLTMVAVNDAPVAVNDSATTNEDTAVTTANVLLNDSDVDNALTPASITAFSQGANGSVVNNGDGTFSYTPNPNFNGTDSFTYTITDAGGLTSTATVTVTVNPVNDAPVATPDSAVTDEDTPVTTANVLLNDSDVDNTLTPASITAFSQGANGTVVNNGDGTFSYTPNANFNGTDSFSYTITDAGGLTSTATVTVTVNPVNDAPVDGNETNTVTEDTSLDILDGATGDLLNNATDVDGGTLRITQFTVNGQTIPVAANTPVFSPAGGSATIVGVGTIDILSNGAYTFTPASNYTGSIPPITYTVGDGNGGTDTSTLQLTMVAVNDAPVAVDDTIPDIFQDSSPLTIPAGDLLVNDSDLDNVVLTIESVQNLAGGTVTLVNGDPVFTPTPGYNGPASFTYIVSDGNGGFDTATVNFNIIATTLPISTPPIINPDTNTVDEDSPAIGNVLSNDTDPDNDTLRVTSFTVNGTIVSAGSPFVIPNVGALVINGDGTYLFTPVRDFNGSVPAVTYTVADGTGNQIDGILNVLLRPVTDIVNDVFRTPEHQVGVNPLVNDHVFNLLGNDSFGPEARLTAVTQPAHGRVVINPNGTVTFRPDPNFVGTERFRYTITTPDGNTETATVQVIVTPLNDGQIPPPQTSNENIGALILLSNPTQPLFPNAISGAYSLAQFRELDPIWASDKPYNPSRLSLSRDGEQCDLYLKGSLRNQVVLEKQHYNFAIPKESFCHCNINENLEFTATQIDGTPLPQWLQFNPKTLKFSGTPPMHAKTTDVMVAAKDQYGNSVHATFRVVVNKDNMGVSKENRPGAAIKVMRGAQTDNGNAMPLITGRADFSEQLGKAGKLTRLMESRALLDSVGKL